MEQFTSQCAAAFVGMIEPSPTTVRPDSSEPVLVTSWSDYAARFGAPVGDGYLTEAVRGYFVNGGTQAYIVGAAADAASTRAALKQIERLDDVAMVCLPDVWASTTDPAEQLEMQASLIEHCERTGDRTAILDAPPDLTARQAYGWRRESAQFDSSRAVLYFPWLRVFDDLTGTGRYVPPSGHLAGVWARCTGAHGLPRTTSNEVVRGVIGVRCAITSDEHDLLDPVGVNCVRSFRDRGVRVWGARTLASDPRWGDLTVRRLVTHIESSIRLGLASSPSHRAADAQIVQRTLRAFLFQIWIAGGLVGESVREAFTVVCRHDGERLVCEVGIAVSAAGEFVALQFTQAQPT